MAAAHHSLTSNFHAAGLSRLRLYPLRRKQVLADAVSALHNRKPISLTLEPDGTIEFLDRHSGETGWQDDRFTASYEPKLRLRIAGRGADCLALTHLAQASNLPVQLHVTDEEDHNAAQAIGAQDIYRLTSPSDLPAVSDDAWTAFVLMFHDQPWEAPLLQQALTGPAFFVGAVGSRTTHLRRCEILAEIGIPARDIERIRAPIGLVPSMRDANMLAISALAEIVEAFHQRAAV